MPFLPPARRCAGVVFGLALATFPAIGAPPLIPCPGDADRDLRVGYSDIAAVLTHWGATGPEGDANGDSVVDFEDITTVLAEWNVDCAAAFIAGPASGARDVARRIVGLDETSCRLFMCGDSISSDSFSQNNTHNTGFHYGIIRKWMPPNWSGLFMTANGSSGDRYGFGTITPNSVRSAGSTLPGIGSGYLPVNATDIEFQFNASPFGPFQQLYTQQLGVRYGVGPWPAHRALVARFIYLSQPSGVPLRLRTWRPAFNVVGEVNNANLPADPTITYLDIPIPASPEPNFGAGVYGAAPDIDETGFRLITLGVRVFDPASPGFELAVAGVGGSTPKDHTRAGGPVRRYSDEALTQLLGALDSNTFWIKLGANQADGTVMLQQLQAGDDTLYRQYMLDVIDRYHDAAIAAGNPDPKFLLLHTYKLGWDLTNTQTRWAALASIAQERTDTLAVNLYALCGEDIEPYLVDTAHMNWQGSDRFASLIWELLTALANRAD